MSERTAASLRALDVLLDRIPALPPSPDREQVLEETTALRRAVAAFHMEAIRFRMHAVDRLLHLMGDDAAARHAFEEVRRELESAGFHTRSHAAPGT
jgi:hypothetical protein